MTYWLGNGRSALLHRKLVSKQVGLGIGSGVLLIFIVFLIATCCVTADALVVEPSASTMVKGSDVIAVIRTEWFRQSPGLAKATVTAQVLHVLKGHLAQKEISFLVCHGEDRDYAIYSPSRTLLVFFMKRGNRLVADSPGRKAYRIQNGYVLHWPTGSGRSWGEDAPTGNVSCHAVFAQIARLSHQRQAEHFVCPSASTSKLKLSTMTRVLKLAKESTSVALVIVQWIEPKRLSDGHTQAVFRTEIDESISGDAFSNHPIISIVGNSSLRNRYRILGNYIVFLKRIGNEWQFVDESVAPLDCSGIRVIGIQDKEPVYRELKSRIVRASR